MEHAILFGNGFNLLSSGSISWTRILSDLSDKNVSTVLKDIPPTLQYEQVYLSPKNSRYRDEATDKAEESLKKAVKRQLEKLRSNDFYKELIGLGAKIYLTTNYDHAFYDNDKTTIISRNASESLYSIRRWKKLSLDGKECILYQIHGDMSAFKSIMLGLDHYVGALAKIEKFVKGHYSLSNDDKKKVFPEIPSVYTRLKGDPILSCNEYGLKDSGFGLLSWVDAFFFCDLHIIGLSLDFSEIDLWWLLSRRARLMKVGKIKNKIYFYPTFPLSEIHHHLQKLRLLEEMGVTIVHHNSNADILRREPDYQGIYQEQLSNIRQIIG